MILSSHTEMSCLTSEGTGKNHPWQVEVNAQLPAVYDVGTSYSPPVIAVFEGSSTIGESGWPT